MSVLTKRQIDRVTCTFLLLAKYDAKTKLRYATPLLFCPGHFAIFDREELSFGTTKLEYIFAR